MAKFAQKKATAVAQDRGPAPGYFNFDFETPDQWYDTARQNSGEQDPFAQPTEYNERGLPVDWDYKTATYGPQGNSLPETAKGWDPNGRPDFGVSPGDLWNRFTWKLGGDREQFSEDNEKTAKSLVDGFSQNYEAQKEVAAKSEEGKAVLGVLGAAVGTILQGIGGLWTSLEGNDDSINVLNAIPRVIGGAIDTLGYGFEAWDRGRKEELLVPRWLQAQDVLLKESLVSQETMDEWSSWSGGVGSFPIYARVAYGVIAGNIDIDD